MRLTPVIAGSALALTAVLAGCGTRSGSPPSTATVPAKVVAAASASPAAQPGKPVSSNPQSQPSQSAQPPLPAGQVGTLSQVPWPQVGSGWALAEFTAGSYQVAKPVTLYMIDPAGGKYRLYAWPATTQPWHLVDWSGDKTRVLLEELGAGPFVLHQLTLATGQLTSFTLPRAVTQVLGYTRPDGDNILVNQDGIARYSLAGVLQGRLSQGSEFGSAISSPDGLTEVVSGGTGVDLVSNSGDKVRWLPVPGASAAEGGCLPERWWNAAEVLVSCIPNGASGPRVWLVPVSGAAPTALTPTRVADSADLGDLDAWHLPGGLYVQALGGCGTKFIGRQSATGTVQTVIVPGSEGNNVVIATSARRMLVQEISECTPASTLVWLNPATGAVQPVLTAQPKTTGVASAIPFNEYGEQPRPLS
jgi:TolB protein